MAATLGLVAVVAALGCASRPGDRWFDPVSAGQRAEHAGRFEDAARAYDSAARAATRTKDRDEAHFMEARVYHRAERWQDEAALYRRILAESPRGPRAERADFELANVTIEHGDAEQGWRMLLEATHRHPNSGIAAHAIHRLVEHEADRAGDAAAIAWLEREAPAFRGTELDQAVAYERARKLDAMGRDREAHDVYVATAKAHPYPFGNLTDDALWRAAEIDERDKRYDEAIAHLHDLVGSQESSQTPGSYNRPRYSQAQLKIAELYRDGLHNHGAARREFHKVYTNHPTSVLRDDALWYEAELAAADGDRDAACGLVGALVKEFPDSRYVPCARELCASAAAANTTCAVYIKEQASSLLPHRSPSP